MEQVVLVSPDGLSGLVGRLRTVAHELRSAGSAGTSDGHTGHGGLEHALDAFHRSWSAKRTELADEVERAAQSLQNALESFSQADESLARSVDGAHR